MKNSIKLAIIGLLSGLTGAWIFSQLNTENPGVVQMPHEDTVESTSPEFAENNGEMVSTGFNLPSTDFVKASELSTHSVVYIRNLSEKSYSVSWMDMLFGIEPNTQVRVSSGSGVIFTEDGYIVTNNHVIDDADKIEVIYDKKTFEADLIGVDPSTDLAVLKIDAKRLPAIPIGNSKNLNVGEWVIAVGNPFNLTSTVTAGIVSAKGRQINILKEKFPIESFIQTDAAINPGNSGGALVNAEGKLVGINTAILSKTGSYAGYGFAVPVDIVNKIFHDLVKYGEVQKAFFGGDVEDFNSQIADRFDINKDHYDGVLLVYLQGEGAAGKAGLKEGDVIVSIDGEKINTRAEFEEEISYRSPGDKIKVGYERKDESFVTEVVLTNREGTTGILKRVVLKSKNLGAEFEEVPKVEKDLMGIDYGVRIFNVGRGRLSGMEEGFIVTHINQTPIKSAEKLVEILENIDGVVYIQGMNAKGQRGRYRFYGR